jgi:hypothetical protein
MAWASCPKCGYAEQFEDECPKCGVYVSKYIVAQERLSSIGPWQGTPSPPPIRLGTVPPAARPKSVPPAARPKSVPPVARSGSVPPAARSGSVPPATPQAVRRGATPPVGVYAATLPAHAEPSGIGSVITWVFILFVLAGAGYVVIVDWFGAGYHFDAPHGWQKVDDDLTEQAVQGMCPRVREKTTLHAVYTLVGATAQTAMGIIEIDERVPVDDALLTQLRTGFDQAAGQLPGIKLARAERVFYAGWPAAEIQVDLEMAGTKNTVLQVVMNTDHTTMVFVLIAPHNVFRGQIDAVHVALATLHPLPEGLRGKPWFKYSLRWLWVLAVAGALLYGLSRLRRTS